jgi:type VI secretion system secreted protein Hcp
MPEAPHLKLSIGGSPVSGVSTQFTDGSIECLSFSWGVTNPIDWATGSASGRAQYQAIAISKRVDKTSPLLHKALCTNQAVEGTFKFFHPPADAKDKTDNFYTVEFKFGRVEAISFTSGSNDIPMETVTFAYRAVTLTFVKGGISSADDWNNRT